MAKERMGRVDHAWLRMDDPRNWMIITGLMTLSAPLDVERFKETVQATLLQFPRFRQKISWSRLPLRRPSWQDDPHFNLDAHIERVKLPEPADQAALQALVSELMSYGLEYDHPLWRFYVVENYQKGSALVARLHHCLADGMALVRVLLGMTDNTPVSPPLQPDLPTLSHTETPHDHHWMEETLGLIPAAVRGAAKAANQLTQASLKTLEDPASLVDKARLGAGALTAAGRMILRWPDPPTIFRSPLGQAKRAAWSQPLLLADVKRIGQAHGATVNDVLINAVAGALRRYLLYRKQPVDGLSIRGFIPVNLRPLEKAIELGNKFGLVFLDLPLGVADPVRRLRALKRNMDSIKGSQEAIASFGILALIGSVPDWLQSVGISIFDAKGTAVMTNVPGPKEQLYLCGSPIETVMAWVPQSGRVSLGVSIISYNGQVWLGIATDQRLAPDPQRIVAEFEAEFKAILAGAEQSLEKRAAPVRSLLSQLDQTLASLDELLENEKIKPVHCQGRTRSGAPCKNPPFPGQRYCRVHVR
jgi:WS/DGAT/MGAT family acyltransferase